MLVMHFAPNLLMMDISAIQIKWTLNGPNLYSWSYPYRWLNSDELFLDRGAKSSEIQYKLFSC